MASLCSDMISREAHWKTLKNYVDKYDPNMKFDLNFCGFKTVTYRDKCLHNKSTK